MKIFKKLHFTLKIWEKKRQLWDREFTKRFLNQEREGLRIEYDRLKEQLDAAQRRLMAELYEVFDGPEKHKMDIRTLPLPPEDIAALPDNEPTDQSRFFKVEKQDPDKTMVEQLTKKVAQVKPDVQQLETQMKNISLRVEGPLKDDQGQDHSLNGSMDDMRTLINLLRTHRREL